MNTPTAQMNSLRSYWTRLHHFLHKELWQLQTDGLPSLKSFVITQLRILILACRGFYEDRCYLRASALTFYSLLAIVPIFAMAFGVAKGFGFEKSLRAEVLQKFSGQEEVLTKVLAFSDSLLAQTQGGIIAGIGIVILFWTVIKVLGNIEHSFNDIWGIQRSRSLGRKFSDYLSFMLICPILLLMSSSATVLLSSQISAITERIELLGVVAPLVSLTLGFAPLLVLVIAFTFMYVFLPNTEVRFSSALLGAVVAAIGYHMTQWAYIRFQIGVAQYGAIYGSFAALPLFLIWLQLSWLIVLFGAEVSFAKQNVKTYIFETLSSGASLSFRRLLALRITQEVAQRFYHENSPPSSTQLSELLGAPIRLVQQTVEELCDAAILAHSSYGPNRDEALQPAVPLERLTVNRVLKSLDDLGSKDLPLADSQDTQVLKDCLDKLEDSRDSSSGNKLLLELKK